MRNLDLLKPFALGAAIVAALILKSGSSHAAETETAIVAGGCFWCVEADFEKVRGVSEVVSGFAGGTVANPSYRQVTRGGTGHLEAVEITFDPSVVSYTQIVDLFLRSIDPFDDGGQFCDRGPSYAPAIFASTPEQQRAAGAAIARAEGQLGREFKVALRQAATLYPESAYHQNYYKQSDIIITRFGPLSKSKAYLRYRDACGRDDRVRAIWGSSAPFTGS
ncbi:MAG: peptide-methionine (S)-S-oxide reductase MsrA [Pseudomonadota bacterium]